MESELHPGLVAAMRLGAGPSWTGIGPLPSEVVAEMNEVYEQYMDNVAEEHLRRVSTGDTEVNSVHVARQKELMARIIRRCSRRMGKTMDRGNFAQKRQAAVDRASKDDRLNADYIGSLLAGAEDRAWRRCGHCDRERSDMKRCGQCREVRYCGKECQRAHWAIHRKNCRSQN